MPAPQWLSILPDLATVFAVLVAAAGLLYTGKQLELARKATAAQLLLYVDESLREFDETIYGLRNGSVRGDEFEVQRLMGAMERLHVLVSKGLVEPEEIADLHGWRLETLLGNAMVRSYIAAYPEEWRRLTDLEQRLGEHRTGTTRTRGRQLRHN